METMRLYNYLKKLQTEKDAEKQMRAEEKSYQKDFWSTARNVTNGTFGKNHHNSHLKKAQLMSTTKTNMKKSPL